MTMTTDEFFAEAKRLGCRMHLGPEDQRAAFDLKDAEIERLRAALGVVRRHDAGTMKRDCMETKDDHQFIVRTNEQYAAWCKTYYQLDALDRRGMASLHGLWAWQEQERRRVKEIEGIGLLCAVKEL